MSGRDNNARLESETCSTLELVQNDQAANAGLIVAEDQLQIPEYVHRQRRFDDVEKEEDKRTNKILGKELFDNITKKRYLAGAMVFVAVAIGVGVGVVLNVKKSDISSATAAVAITSNLSSSTPILPSQTANTSPSSSNPKSSSLARAISSYSPSASLDASPSLTPHFTTPIIVSFITISPSRTTTTSSPRGTSTTTAAIPTITCGWMGHCLGATCGNYNDCADPLTCTNGKCAPLP